MTFDETYNLQVAIPLIESGAYARQTATGLSLFASRIATGFTVLIPAAVASPLKSAAIAPFETAEGMYL